MKVVLLKSLENAAKTHPVGYLQECLALGKQEGDSVVFEDDVYASLVAKYRKYNPSEADPYRERISGCCDRADQY